MSTLKLVPVVKACCQPNVKKVVLVVTTGDPATTSVFRGLAVRSQLKSKLRVGSKPPRGCTVSERDEPVMAPTPETLPPCPPPPPTPAPTAEEKSASGMTAPPESTPRAACPDFVRKRSAWAK